MKQNNEGFSLIEILLVVSIIAVLSTILITVMNPARQFSKARDMERETDLISILSSVTQYASEHSGSLPDNDGDEMIDSFPTTPTCIGSGGGCFDLASSGDEGDTIVPVYLPAVPSDPSDGDDSNTGYVIWVDENDRLVASASAETKDSIQITR